jgi:hypothetical protein
MFLALTACNRATPVNPKPTNPVLTIESLTATPDISNSLKVTFDWKIVNAAKEQCHLDVTADGKADFSFVCAEEKSYVHTYSQANTYSAKLWVDGQATTNKEISVEVTPPLSKQTFIFDKSVTWAAYQKDGVWQVLELSETRRTKLSLAVEQGAIAYVCDDLADANNSYLSNEIFYFTHDGLQEFLEDNLLESFPTIYCDYPYPPRPPRSTTNISGTVSGLSLTDSLEIRFYGVTSSNGDDLYPGQFPKYKTWGGVEAGTYDVLAAVTPNKATAPTKAVFYPQAVTVTDMDVTFDIDLADAVTLDSYKFSVKGLQNIESTWNLATANGLTMYKRDSAGTATSFNYAAFPIGYLPETGYWLHTHAVANGCDYSLSATVKTPGNYQVSAPPCASITFETKNSLPSLAWSYGTTYQADMMGVYFEQGRVFSDTGEGSGYGFGTAFYGDFSAMTSYTLEDFSSLPGWKPEWSPKNEATKYGFYNQSRQLFADGNLYTSVATEGEFRP